MPKNAADPLLAEALSQALRRRREAIGLSQEKVAQRADISRNQYQLLERGLSVRAGELPANPTLSTLKKLSDGLGITLVELVADLSYPPGDAVQDDHTPHKRPSRRRH